MNRIALATATLLLSGCAVNGLPTAGPSRANVTSTADAGAYRVVDLDVATAAKLAADSQRDSLAKLPPAEVLHDRIAAGDRIEVTIWEAAPATLFAGISEALVQNSGRAVTLPTQVVDLAGTINIPYVGRVVVAGRTAASIEAEILAGLKGKANQPQVLVRSTSNVAQEVTVVGEVAASVRVPLTPKGERLLDALAAAGGAKVPLEKATVQVTRGAHAHSIALDAVVRDPSQNVPLAANDVITVYHQPLSFVAMGAVNKVGEVDFEATGLTLAQALARVGGPTDNRADPAGVFVARTVGEEATVYRLNLRDPASLFAMRQFAMADGDVLYVANSPATELQKFLGILGAAVYPLDAVRNFNRG